MLRNTLGLALASGIAGCGGIGDGNTIESIALTVLPVEGFEQGVIVDGGLPTERYHMYDCFCANLAAIATFTDESLADFSNRVTFTSDNEAVVEVLNVDESDTEACPAGQNAAGMLIPRSIGTAVVTATYGPLSTQITVEVADASAGTYVLEAAPPADGADTDVAVGASLPLRIIATLDGRTRNVSRNAHTWEVVEDADGDFLALDANGVARGVAATGATPLTARAVFGTCSDVSPTALVNVGEILGPLTVEREAPDFAFDTLLAVNSDELLVVKGPLDFDGDAVADGEQLLSQQIGLTYAESCELREFDDTVPTTNCKVTNTVCDTDVSVCTADTCVAGMEACRVQASAFLRGTINNQVIAFNERAWPTAFSATFPRLRGTATALEGAIDAAATTIVVEALAGYPTTFPWFGVIDAAGTREDVRVTAADGTTLTVVRGVGGTAAAAHADGATFEQRSHGTATPLDITAKDGTLTTFAIDPPGTPDPFGQLQLRAEGTFVDEASASRQQRVSRLIAPLSRGSAPTIEWISGDTTVADFAADDGLLTSASICGGRVTVRARATTSTDETTEEFDPDSTADDDACLADALCDQLEVCLATPVPLPLGATCETTTTCP